MIPKTQREREIGFVLKVASPVAYSEQISEMERFAKIVKDLSR